MVASTVFARDDFEAILSEYDIGNYESSEAVKQGTVQTVYFLNTSQGKFVFKYYDDRSSGYVLFESDLIEFLTKKNYPCAPQIANNLEEFIGVYNEKPFLIFNLVEGEHLSTPNDSQYRQLVGKIAKLHILTRDYRSKFEKYRWNYNAEFCGKVARKKAEQIGTTNARKKLTWFENILQQLELPDSLPMGICHCDLYPSNIIYKQGEFRAIVDFDNSNYTFLTFDLVCLIGSRAWQDGRKQINFHEAKKIVSEYAEYRQLMNIERRHLFDVYKLSILFECVWVFNRGDASNFYERAKIDFLNKCGREGFSNAIFS